MQRSNDTGANAPPAFRLRQGTRPLLLSMPHVGTYVPPAIEAQLSQAARTLADTDWHLERLYDFADAIGASVLVATHSRYVIDANRPPDDHSLYPGQDTTGLCPIDTFDREPLYISATPAAGEILARRRMVHDPYHAALRDELMRLRAQHAKVVLWDAHSIRSVVPRFFDGRLPDFNFGTVDGTSCDPALAARLLEIAQHAAGYSSVLDGRFRGGYITRRYGDPQRGVHAVQLEMAQRVYMNEAPPYDYLPERAARVRPHLAAMLDTMLAFAEHR